MEWGVVRRCLYRSPNVTHRWIQSLSLEPDARQGFVMISPGSVRPYLSPRRALADHNALAELIEPKHVLPFRRLPQDQDQIREAGFDCAVLLVEDQVITPPSASMWPPQFRFCVFFCLVEAVPQKLFEHPRFEAAKMLLPLAAGGMERSVDRQGYLEAIRIERDPAQLLNRSRGGYDLIQAKLLKHRIGPLEQLPLALRLVSRVVVGAFCP